MAKVRGQSVIYKITKGKHRGRTCVIMNFTTDSEGEEITLSTDGITGIIFTDVGFEETTREKLDFLSPLVMPGWPDEININPYGFEAHLQRQGSGDCCLRTLKASQPRATKVGDILADSDEVLSIPRRGFNSSSLIKTAKHGWVEIAPRIPIALFGSGREDFKMPQNLLKGDNIYETERKLCFCFVLAIILSN